MKINLLKNFEINFKKNLIYSILFLIIFLIDYYSLHILYHGSRKIHIFLISLSLSHSLVSIIFIHFFFIKNNDKLLNIFEFSEIGRFVSKYKIDILLVLILLVSSFVVAFTYTSFIEKKNLMLLSYDSTAALPKILVPFKKEFSSLLFSLSVLFSFLIFRLFKINRSISLILSIIFLTSPIHIYHLFPSPFRDYFSKTIFLFMIFSSFMIIHRKFDFNIFKIFVLISTIILSYGLYIRQDLIIFLFPFILVIVFYFFKNKLIHKKDFYYIISSVIIILVPQLLRFNGTIGNVVGGLITPTEGNFFLQRPLYDFGYIFKDNFLWLVTIIDSQIFSKILINFPADFLIKIFDSIQRILKLSNESLLIMPGIENNYIITFYELRAKFISLFGNEVIFFIFLSFLFLLIYKNLTSGIATLILIFILLSYPVLNFYGRHYFYLEIIPLLSIGFFVQSLINYIHQYKKINLSINFIRIRNVIALFIFLCLASFLTFNVSKNYQKSNFEKILVKLNNLPKEELKTYEKDGANTTLFKINSNFLFKNKIYPDDLFGLSGNVEHIILEFDFASCGLETVWPTLRYRNKNRDKYRHWMNYDRTIKINKSDLLEKNSLVIFPVYRQVMLNDLGKEIKPENIDAQVEFEGIEFNKFEKGCFSKLYKLTEYPNNLPKSLSIFGYNQKPYFQFLNDTNFYMVPKNIKKTVENTIENYSFEVIDNSIIEYKSKFFDANSFPSTVISYAGSVDNNHCKLRGSVEKNTRFAYEIIKDFYFLKNLPCTNEEDLLWTKEVKLNKGDIFVLEGEIINGGLRAGFKNKKENRAYVQIENKGNFKVMMKIPVNGNYNVGLSNFTTLYTYKENHIVIKNVGFLKKN